jgi:Na+-translocating ferredoxin:NAD+ oxidoreductase RnfD subunit
MAAWIEPASAWPGRLLEYATFQAPVADAVSRATPLVEAAGADPSFASFGALLFGNLEGCIGSTSAGAILVGGLALLAMRVINWRTVVATLGTFAALAAVLHAAAPGTFGPAEGMPAWPLWQLLAGGLFFGAFFMATDPVSGPITNGGKWVYGAIIGGVTLLIRGLAGFPEGVMFAILLGNVAAPILDDIAVRVRLRRLAHEH